MQGLVEYKDKDSNHSDIQLFKHFHYVIDKDDKGWFFSKIGLGVDSNKKYCESRELCLDHIWEKLYYHGNAIHEIYYNRDIITYDTDYD